MNSASGLGAGLDPGARFPDFTRCPTMPATNAGCRTSWAAIPTVLQFFRGWWCPKEQEFFRRMLREGVLGAAHPPVGPVIERYGSANPWPGDRFAGQES